MQSTRSALVFGLIILALAGVVAPDSQAATVSSFTTVPGVGGDVTLSFTVTGTAPMTVDVFRLVSTSQPLPSQFISGTLVADNVAITSGVQKVMVNTTNEATNMANGFLAGKTTVSKGLYWYMLRVTEPGPVVTESSIRGAVADANPPSTLADGDLTIACENATADIEVAFTNPYDDVVDASADMAVNPGSVPQHASPSQNYSFDFLLYRVAQSEAFDVVNDPVAGNVVATVEIDPYNRGQQTSYVDSPSVAGAYAYAIRIQDTVGNLNGGSPLSQTQAINVVTPPTDVAVSEALVSGLPTCIVTFTANTASLVSDPGDVSPAVIRLYARDDGTPITAANIGDAGTYLIEERSITSGAASEVVTFNHDPNNAVLPRISPETYTYAVIMETDNGRISCLSNSPSITTTDLLPPAQITLVSPADGLTCVRGNQMFTATVADDAGGSGIQSVTFTLEDASGTVTVLGAALNVTVGGAVGTASLSVDTTAIPDGVYIYSATAFDFAGNSLETGSGDPGAGPDFTISINNNPATVVFTSPVAGDAVHGTFDLSGTAASASVITEVTVVYSTSGVDAAVLASGTDTWTASIPVDASMADGDILTVTVEVHDACGLISTSVTRDFCVDALCVTLAGFDLVPGAVFGPAGLIVSATVADDDAGSACDAGILGAELSVLSSGYSYATAPSTAPQAGSFTFSNPSLYGLADGQSGVLVLSATDGAIDVPNTCDLQSVTITADYSAPACTIVSPVSGTCAGTFVISGTAEDFGAAGIDEVTVLISGPVSSVSSFGAVTSFSDVFAPGVDGTYSIVVNVTDTVGNTSSCGPVSVTVDIAAPLVAILSPMPVANVGVNGSFIVSGTAEDLGCSGVMDMTVEYTTGSGTAQAPVTFSPVGGMQVTWSVAVPVDAALADDAAFTVTVMAVDGIPEMGSTSATYFVDDTDSCPTLSTPLANSTVFLGAAGLPVAYSAADDDFSTSYDTGVSMVYASVSSPSVSPASTTLFSSLPPALGVTSATNTLVAGSGTGATGEIAFGLTDGDIADINVCVVDGATGTTNVCCSQFQVHVDLTDPTACAILFPTEGECLDYGDLVLGATNVIVEATDDNSGLAEVGVTVLYGGAYPIFEASTPASGLVATSAISVPFTLFIPGTYTIVTTVTDVAGNVSEDCDSVTFNLNTSLPYSPITSPREAVVNNNFDLTGTAVVPSYASGSAGVPGSGTPGTEEDLYLYDDDYEAIPLNFLFPFYGQIYSTMYVGSNGYITFLSGDYDWSPGYSELVSDLPRISFAWDDLEPDAVNPTSISVENQLDRVIVRFDQVPNYDDYSNVISVTATLFSTGAITFQYGDVIPASGSVFYPLVAVTPGFTGTTPPQVVDMVGSSPHVMSGGALYEPFDPVTIANLVNQTVVFLPVNDLVNSAATSARIYYPGPGGGILPALNPTVEAAVAPLPVFNPSIDDASSVRMVPFSNGFQFPFYGATYGGVYVSARGVLGFENSAFGPFALSYPTPDVSYVNMINPKIMPFWGDLDASGVQGGSTTYRQYDDRFVVDFRGIPDSSGSGSNDFSVVLFDTGAVQFIYGQQMSFSPSVSQPVAVGISAAVVDQDVSGYNDVYLLTNGIPRSATDLSGVTGSPTLAAVNDNALYQIFDAGAFDLHVSGTTTTYNIQGTSVSSPLLLGASGEWAFNLALPNNNFYANGDCLAVSVRAIGGCDGTTPGPGENRLYVIDTTGPSTVVTGVMVNGVPVTGGVSCISDDFTVEGLMSDDAGPSARIDSGITDARLVFYQNGLEVASLDIDSGSNGESIPTRPNAGVIEINELIDPVAIGIAPGYFGIEIEATDGAILVANVGGETSGTPAENFFFDPTEPKSQVVCSRLFIAAITEVAGVSQTTIFELDPDSGAELASIVLPASLSSPLGSALGYNGVNLYYAPTLDAASPAAVYAFTMITGPSAVSGPSAIAATYIMPSTVTHITGIGADDDTVYVNGPVGANYVHMFDAASMVYEGTQSIGFAPFSDTDSTDVGSGIFDRSFVVRHLNILSTPTSVLVESYPDSNAPGGSQMIYPIAGDQAVGVGFSGTRLYMASSSNNDIREIVTTDEHRTYNGSPILNTLSIPTGYTVQTVAAGARVTSCTLCGPSLPYNLTSAVTDTSACGIGQVAFYGFDSTVGITGEVLFGVASAVPELVNRNLSQFDESAVAIASATLTEASAFQMLPDGEGVLTLYSLATDGSGNQETLAAALARAVTLTIDAREPRINYLAAVPFAATSGADTTIELTLRIEELGSGLDPADPPVLVAKFGVFAASGVNDVTLPLTLASPVLGVVTATASFVPSALGLPLDGGAYIDFVASATDNCGNATDVVLADRFIVDNQSPMADDLDPYYPAEAIIANGTTGNSLWSMTNTLTWTANELRDPAGWDLGFILNTTNPGLNAQRPEYLAGTFQYPVMPEILSQDFRGLLPEVDVAASPSGIASVQLFYATGTSSATPPLTAFSNLIQTITEVVPVTGGGYVPLDTAGAASSMTGTFVWDTSHLKTTASGSDDYYYLKTISQDHAGNLLDPVFGPFVVLDVLSPTRTIITAEALFGTNDVRIDWEYVPYDNVGVVGYEIYRTRDAVDDVLDADPLNDFSLLATIDAYDRPLGDPARQAITEYIDTSVPSEGSYAYYIAAFDASGNGRTGGMGLAAVISNIVVAAPFDLVDPYPVTDLKVRAGEPQNGNLLAWSVPNQPIGGGTVYPLGDNIAISGWEIYRNDSGAILQQSDVSDSDGDQLTTPLDPDVHLIARIDNLLVMDNVSDTSRVRLNPTYIAAEKATIKAASPDQIYLFMKPIDADRISRVWNKTTGETYAVVGVSGAVVQIEGTNLPTANDVVLVDYETNARTFVDIEVIPGNTYSYAVVARDAAGNRSLISTTVLADDPVAVAFDTTAPEAIDTLAAEPEECTGMRVFWAEAPYDETAIMGYNAYRHDGDWAIDNVSDPDEELVRQAVYPVITVAPMDATETITLAAADVPDELFVISDSTRNRLIPSATDVADPINDTYFVVTGDQLEVRNIKTTAGFLHNLKVVYFNPELALFSGTGYDAQLSFVDAPITMYGMYTYSVLAVDPWGNVAGVSNQGTNYSRDCVAPQAPVATVQSNCSYANDVVSVMVQDDDVAMVCAYDNVFLTGPAIACVEDPDQDGVYGLPIGDNQFEYVWVSAIDFAGNTSPSVEVVNDIVPPAKPDASGVQLIQSAPGSDDILTVISLDPGAYRVNVYRDDSLMNLVDSALDGDDGLVNGQWTLNLGDNTSQTFFVTIADEACNESDDLEVSNDTTPPGTPTNVVVSNNISGSMCDRIPVEDTLTACVGSGVVMLEVFADASLLTPVTAASVTAGPSGSCVGPIGIGNNNSFTPGSLSGVYVVATDSAGNKSAAVYAAVDITAPEIASLVPFEQFPQTAGTFPRVEDELDVQIDIDTADVDEVLCVKVFTESPTLNRESPILLTAAGVVTEDIAPSANNDVLAVCGFGAEGVADDLLVSVWPDFSIHFLNNTLLNPTALAIQGEGTGNVWVASVNPSATAEVRLTELTQAGAVVQTVDLSVTAPVAGMTFVGDVLYFVTENGGAIFTFDTIALTQAQLTITTGTVGMASSIAFDGIDRIYFMDLEDSLDLRTGRLQSIAVTGGNIETLLANLVAPAGLAIDRRGGIHYGESYGTYGGFIVNPQGRVSELRPGASGPLTLFEGGDYEPVGDTLVGPVIAADGRMVTVGRYYNMIAVYTSNRRGVDVPDTGVGLPVPQYARVLAEQVPGSDYRVEGIKIGDNAVHEIQAVVVDKAGNTSTVATAINDVVGPVIGDVEVIERTPGYEDYIVGWTDPFSVVRAYADPYLNSEIDRSDNAVYSDRTGDFNFGAIGDNLYPFVFVAAEDAAGNVGQSMFAINDIFEPYAPDLSLIEVVSACPGSDDMVLGLPGSVEPETWVEVYADYELTQYVGGAYSNLDGSFDPISIGDDEVGYAMVLCIDDAGNVSQAVMLDGTNGHAINDLASPEPVDVSNVELTQAGTGEDFVTGLPGAVIPGDASLVRIYTDEDLTTELAGLSPIIVDSATGGWSIASVGTNMVVNNTLYGYASLWLVAEDDACNQALPVRIDLDRSVYEPLAAKFVFNADDPNNNTIAGIEAAGGAIDQLSFSTTVADATSSVLGLPLLGWAITDHAGAFQAINVGRVGVPVSYVVAVDEYGNVSPVVAIDTADTVAPSAPDVSRIVLTERGKSFNDTIAGLRGAVGTGEENLFLNAYTDETLTTLVSGFPVSIPAAAAAPGSFVATSIGENYANNTVNPATVVGMSRVWLTAEDEFGNESEAVYIGLDVTIANPDSSKIFVYSENPQTDAYVSALNNAVEGKSRIQVSADKNNILLYGNFYANSNGGWEAVDVGSLLRQPDVISGSYNFPNRRDTVYVRSIDTAGNRSAVVPINVEIVTYAVLDAFGDITFRNGVDGVADTLQADVLTDAVARDITPGFYHSDGALPNGFNVGDGTLPEFTNSPSGFYRMTGYGEVVALGDILPVDQTGFTPFTSDVARDMEVAPIQAGPNAGMYMLDGFGGLTVFGGATSLSGIVFGFDFARDLELDYDVDGTVKGAYILDGSGGMNPVGASVVLTPANTYNGGQDLYIDAELVRTPGSFEVEGALVLSKFGAVTVGGALATDPIRVDSLIDGLPNFGFDIARDLELSLNRETRNVNGTYVLDGFGGVHAGGAAPKIHDAPFYGFDIARDLEISTYVPQE